MSAARLPRRPTGGRLVAAPRGGDRPPRQDRLDDLDALSPAMPVRPAPRCRPRSRRSPRACSRPRRSAPRASHDSVRRSLARWTPARCEHRSMPPRPSRTGPWTGTIRDGSCCSPAPPGAAPSSSALDFARHHGRAGRSEPLRPRADGRREAGLGAAIVRDGDVAAAGVWPTSGRALAVARDTLFMLASVSKTVVATAVLGRRGRLFELDTDVNEVLPFPVQRSRGRADHDPASDDAHVEHPRQLDRADRGLRDRRRRDAAGDVPPSVPHRRRRGLRRTTTAGSAQAVPTGTATSVPPWRPSWSRRRPGSGSTTGARSGSSRRWA